VLVADGALFGVGCIASYGAWASCYARSGGLDILLNAAAAQFVAGLVAFGLSRTGPVAGLLVLAALYALASAAQLRLCSEPLAEETPAGDVLYRADEPAAMRFVPVVLLFAATVVAAAATGGAVNVASHGATGVVVPCATLCVAGVVSVWESRGKDGTRLAFVVLAALAALGIFAGAALSGESGAGFADVTLFFAVDLSNVFGWVFVCRMTRTRCAGRPLFAVLVRAVMGLAFVASMIMAHYGLAIALSGLLESALFVALLVCAGVLFGAGRSAAPAADAATDVSEGRPAGQELLDERFVELGYSPREAEVATYLVHGYRAPYIAQKLCISENTVRTHIKSMYRKSGVSSRNELLELFEDQRS
jgi:DNA-binding CsgD family transcriptional regulator